MVRCIHPLTILPVVPISLTLRAFPFVTRSLSGCVSLVVALHACRCLSFYFRWNLCAMARFFSNSNKAAHLFGDVRPLFVTSRYIVARDSVIRLPLSPPPGFKSGTPTTERRGRGDCGCRRKVMTPTAQSYRPPQSFQLSMLCRSRGERMIQLQIGSNI